jgi:hypothetical protein
VPTHEQRQRLVELAGQHGIRKDEIDGKPVSMLTIVKFAGGQASLDHVEIYWRLLSGLAHGQQWSGQAAHLQREVPRQPVGRSRLDDPDVADVETASRWSYV